MKAAVITAPNTIEYLTDYIEPELGDGFLLEIHASGICSTDIKSLSGDRPGMKPPLILGHEFSGSIIESRLPKFNKGDRVSVAPYSGCGFCNYCLTGHEELCRQKLFISNGSFAEMVDVPKLLAQKTAWKIPMNISFEEAAMAEPLACVVLSMRSFQWKPGWNILIVGAGFMGLLHILVAEAWGASKILVSEPNPLRRAIAESLGAQTFDPTKNENIQNWTLNQTEGLGPNVVIIAVASEKVVDTAINCARPGGIVHLFGGLPKDQYLYISSYAIHYKSVSLMGSSGFRTSDYKLASQLIAEGKINLKTLVTHRFPLKQASLAFEKTKRPEAIKIILNPN